MEEADLTGWFLSDDDNNPQRWEFPSVMLDPGSFLVVFASGKDRDARPFLHTNFSISASGEPLILSDAAGADH